MIFIVFLIVISLSQDIQIQCGEKCNWKYENFVLTISGKGEMYNFQNSNTSWSSTIKDETTEIIIEYGITSIGSYTFSYFKSLKTITFPETILSIGE